jgi:hypothetical protein
MTMSDRSIVPPRYWLPVLQILGLVACIGLVLWPQVEWSFEAAKRYRGDEASDWQATNVWLQSAECARESGAWLAICDQGRLIPISDRALADDPGHALVLALWARAADRSILVIDVAHLNLVINLVGLLLLAGLLLVLGSYASAVVLLLLGPYVFLEWFGTSPHWAFIGLTALQPILPLALIARWRRWVPPWASAGLVLLGLLTLAFASLVREAIAQMTLVVTLGTLAWMAVASRADGRRLAGLLVLALATLVVSQAARLTLGLRDTLHPVQRAELVPTHGMAHTLYIGLGAVPNRFGIRYEDAAGQEAAARAAPTVRYLSREYFRTMWSLYLARWLDDPIEVLRIYFEKLRLILADRIPDYLPPLWLLLPLLLAVHWWSNGRGLSCGSAACDKRLAIGAVCLAFVGLFVAQAVLAYHTRFYAAPIGAFVIVMLGVALGDLAHWAGRLVGSGGSRASFRTPSQSSGGSLP